MSNKIDIFLACAPKDFIKLPYVIDSIVRNVLERGKIIICSPIPIKESVLSQIKNTAFYTFDDNTTLDCCNRSKWIYRPNWCFQQHLKLFQQVTSDWYLTLDCDTIINRPMTFFEGDKPVCYKGFNQFHAPYFAFMGYMIDLGRISGTSFIADMNLFYRPIITEMLERSQFTIKSFIEKSQKITNKYCHIGEPELYGNYCMKYHGDMYVERFLKQRPFAGRTQEAVLGSVWNKEEIESMISTIASEDYDTFSFHSWLNEGDQNG